MNTSSPLIQALGLLGLLVSACGDESGRSPIRAEAPVLELLARPELRTILRESATSPVREDLMKPRASGREDYGAYPALEFAPPTEIAFELPETYPEARLSIAFAVKRGSYHSARPVRFEVSLDGVVLLETELSASDELPAEERHWHRQELPVGGGGRLVVRTDWDGPAEEAPIVGVGLLRVFVPFEVERLGAEDEGSNVVLIVIDTLRGDRLHSAGNAAAVSPNLDALAARGMRFERAYSAAAWTVPSTASLLSGMPPPAHGVGFGSSYYLADSILTVAEAFQRAGFTTGGFACNPLIAASRGFHQGFEVFQDRSWARASDVFPDVEAFLRDSRDRRFFLYLHYVEPHYPYEPTPAASEGLVSERPQGYLDLELDKYLPGLYADDDVDLAPVLATRDHQLELYDAEIRDVDREIGRVLALLDELGVADRTVVAVTSDHGEEFLENGWAGHHNQLFDGTTRVPLILAGPGVPEGTVFEHPVENRLVATTVLSLGGVEPTENLRGPDLSDPRALEQLALRPVFLTNTKGRVADLDAREQRELGQVHSVIRDGWRLVWEPERPGQGGAGGYTALFDLLGDPDCRVDLSADEPERVESMRGLILRWISDNRSHQPARMGATDATRKLLIEIGYVGEE